MKPIRMASGLPAAIFATGLLACSLAWSQAGQVQSVTGEVQVRRASGQTVPAVADLALGEGDSILTGADSEAQLRMADDARITIRASTQIKLQAYRYEGRDDGSDRSIITLLQGVMRSISGAIGRSNRDRVLIHTPTATIGIRGTDHESAYVPHADPELPGIEPGTYDKVTSGETYIEANGQRIEISPEQAGFAGLDARIAPVRLHEVPAFLRGDARPGRAERDAKRDAKREEKREEKRGDRDQARRNDEVAKPADARDGDRERDAARDRDSAAGRHEARDRDRDREPDRDVHTGREERRERTDRSDRSERKDRRDRVRPRDD